MGGLFWQGLDRLGATDCEAIGEAFLAQPVNALSSLAYLVVGGWLLWRARGGGTPAPTRAFAGAVGAVGVGSFAFHGPMFASAQFLHDLTIATVFAVVLAGGRATARSWPDRSLVAAVGALVVLAAAVLLIAPDAGVIVLGVFATAAAISEVARYRSGRLPVSSGEAPWLRWALLGALLAVVVNLTGRSGGPLCDPESLLQGHATWHIVTALVLGTYGRVAFGGARQPADQGTT